MKGPRVSDHINDLPSISTISWSSIVCSLETVKLAPVVTPKTTPIFKVPISSTTENQNGVPLEGEKVQATNRVHEEPIQMILEQVANAPAGSCLNPIICDDDMDIKPAASIPSIVISNGAALAALPATPKKNIVNPYLTSSVQAVTKTNHTAEKPPPTREQLERMEANRRRALDLQRRHAYQQLAANSNPGPVPGALFREHTFTLLRLMKNIMDWNDEEARGGGRHH